MYDIKELVENYCDSFEENKLARMVTVIYDLDNNKLESFVEKCENISNLLKIGTNVSSIPSFDGGKGKIYIDIPYGMTSKDNVKRFIETINVLKKEFVK